MKTQMFLDSIKYGIPASVVAFSLDARAEPPLELATGQYVTPTALRGAVQQFLNPGLSAYPNFVAGEAVRSQLSPDRGTLAVPCAGQNSLHKPAGPLDGASSTHFNFLS